MKYRSGMTADSPCQDCLANCFQGYHIFLQQPESAFPMTLHKASAHLSSFKRITAVNWEKHLSAVCTRLDRAKSLQEALDLCDEYGPSKCGGVEVTNCDWRFARGDVFLCSPDTMKLASEPFKVSTRCVYTSAWHNARE